MTKEVSLKQIPQQLGFQMWPEPWPQLYSESIRDLELEAAR